MPDVERIVSVVRGWVQKAETDLKTARRAVAMARRIRKHVRKLLPPPALRGSS